jgi:hypothetical protein
MLFYPKTREAFHSWYGIKAELVQDSASGIALLELPPAWKSKKTFAMHICS